MSDPPPDFALLRAVEILEKIAKERSQPIAPVPPVEHPVVLASDRGTFAIGTTRRTTVERTFGRGYSYPAKGFHTYAIPPTELPAEGAPKRWLLSVFYRGDLLFGVEYYIPKVSGLPSLPLATPGAMRVSPGDFKIGGPMNALGYFVPARGGPSPVIYQLCFEARFAGGVAWIMGNAGRIERVAIYGDA